MLHDYTSAMRLAAPRKLARDAAEPARGWLEQFWYRSMSFIARYRARHQLRALNEPLDERLLCDIGLTRAYTPRSLIDPMIDHLQLHGLDAHRRALFIAPFRRE